MKSLKKFLPDFKNQRLQNSSRTWYDVDHDRVLIEQSIAKQYGVLPSEQENLKYSDWAKMVSGLMDDTPLGYVVSIRSETDQEIIRRFTPEQRAIRQDWERVRAKRILQLPEKELRQQFAQLEQAMAAMFAPKGR